MKLSAFEIKQSKKTKSKYDNIRYVLSRMLRETNERNLEIAYAEKPLCNCADPSYKYILQKNG